MNIRYIFTACLIFLGMTFKAAAREEQDSTGLPGDNFSLQGALDLFKRSTSPEEFEKLLNSADSKVNNLDLNGDGNTDYVRVINKKENDVHVFILQALISSTENQDIAVIELEKTGENNAIIQIVGDADIYGESVIAEPAEESGNAFNYSAATYGPSAYAPDGIVVNVWLWPAVRFVYAPAYTVWVSPYTWISRPVWYRPWRPLPWHAYRPIRYSYAHRYVVVPVRRIPPARIIYRPVRTTSVTVINRNRVVVNNYRTNRRVERFAPDRSNGGGRQYQSNSYSRADRGSTVSRGSRVDRNTSANGSRSSGRTSSNRSKSSRKAERGN